MGERRGREALMVSVPRGVAPPLHWVVTLVRVEQESMQAAPREQLPLQQPLLALSALYLPLSQDRF